MDSIFRKKFHNFEEKNDKDVLLNKNNEQKAEVDIEGLLKTLKYTNKMTED